MSNGNVNHLFASHAVFKPTTWDDCRKMFVTPLHIQVLLDLPKRYIQCVGDMPSDNLFEDYGTNTIKDWVVQRCDKHGRHEYYYVYTGAHAFILYACRLMFDNDNELYLERYFQGLM